MPACDYCKRAYLYSKTACGRLPSLPDYVALTGQQRGCMQPEEQLLQPQFELHVPQVPEHVPQVLEQLPQLVLQTVLHVLVQFVAQLVEHVRQELPHVPQVLHVPHVEPEDVESQFCGGNRGRLKNS